MKSIPQHSGEVSKDTFVEHFDAMKSGALSLWAWLEDEKRKALAEERQLGIPPEVQQRLGEALTALEIAYPIVIALK